MYVCTPCVFLVRSEADHIELELQMAMRYLVSSGNQTWVLWTQPKIAIGKAVVSDWFLFLFMCVFRCLGNCQQQAGEQECWSLEYWHYKRLWALDKGAENLTWSFQKRKRFFLTTEPSLQTSSECLMRNCLDKISLWKLSWLLIDVGRPSPLWVASFSKQGFLHSMIQESWVEASKNIWIYPLSALDCECDA